MAYKRILETLDLPEPGPLPEDLRFDMKMQPNEQMRKKPPAQQIEDLACDVAAFANTAGGVLLIGAHETPPGTLKTYVSMSADEAYAVGDSLRKALELCSPKPIADARTIALRDRSGFAVAINCDPYMAPPIGVAQPGHEGGEKWWAFPARRGRDNHNLRPEELATTMDPRLRRISLFIDQMPTSLPANLRRATFHSEEACPGPTLDILSIEQDASVMYVCNQSSSKILIPLDAVRMTWRDPQSGMFQIAVSGRIQVADDRLVFWPVD